MFAQRNKDENGAARARMDSATDGPFNVVQGIPTSETTNPV
jgi:hypothetical protein